MYLLLHPNYQINYCERVTSSPFRCLASAVLVCLFPHLAQMIYCCQYYFITCGQSFVYINFTYITRQIDISQIGNENLDLA